MKRRRVRFDIFEVTQKNKSFVETTYPHFRLPSYINQMLTVLHNNTGGVQPNVPR